MGPMPRQRDGEIRKPRGRDNSKGSPARSLTQKAVSLEVFRLFLARSLCLRPALTVC